MVESPLTRLNADASVLLPKGSFGKILEPNFHHSIQVVLGLLRNFPAT